MLSAIWCIIGFLIGGGLAILFLSYIFGKWLTTHEKGQLIIIEDEGNCKSMYAELKENPNDILKLNYVIFKLNKSSAQKKQ